MIPTSSCSGLPEGGTCDNILYYPTPTTGYFDSNGLALQLGGQQVDGTLCDTNKVFLRAGVPPRSVCDNTIVTQGGADTLTITPITVSNPNPSCSPPLLSIPPLNCSIGGYNFTALSSLPDLSYYSSSSGYTLYMRVCGAVSQADCVRLYGNNVMVCQTSGPSNTYSLAATNSPVGEMVWTYTSDIHIHNRTHIIIDIIHMINDTPIYVYIYIYIYQ